ncbi:MAG: oligosaccharide flippase family protein, partial [Candidatus Brocadiales bacterium]
MHTESIKFRFLASILANVTRMGLGLLTGLLVARGLGPAEFGSFSFLLTSFTAISQLLDMGSSQAFYTFVS